MFSSFGEAEPEDFMAGGQSHEHGDPDSDRRSRGKGVLGLQELASLLAPNLIGERSGGLMRNGRYGAINGGHRHLRRSGLRARRQDPGFGTLRQLAVHRRRHQILGGTLLPNPGGIPAAIHGWRAGLRRLRGGDKISVPEFDGEENAGNEGTRARGYLRRVNAWRRITRLKPCKQALALYNHLSGKAWRDAEELDLDLLDQESGVDVFIAWISSKYLDREVVKVGRCMSEFFKVLKKSSGQDIKDFNPEFDRQTSRLKEVGCQLPDVCLAWWYLDKLRLDNSSELSLLSSTGNNYSLQPLQEAAIIQDRMNRRMWETRRSNKEQRALVADYIDEDPEEDSVIEGDEEADELDDEETQEAFVAFQNANSRYQSMLKARGTTAAPSGSKEDRLRLAKAKSYCSACKKKGHWCTSRTSWTILGGCMLSRTRPAAAPWPARDGWPGIVSWPMLARCPTR